MNKRFKHFISTIIAGLFYFIFQIEIVEEEESQPYAPKCISLTEKNFSTLLVGEWTVITENNNNNLPISSLNTGYRNLAILSISSLSKVTLAAKLGMTDPNGKIYLKNGEFSKDRKVLRIDRVIPLSEIIDFYIFYWALDIKKTISSESSIESMLDRSMNSAAKLASELFSLYVKT